MEYSKPRQLWPELPLDNFYQLTLELTEEMTKVLSETSLYQIGTSRGFQTSRFDEKQVLKYSHLASAALSSKNSLQNKNHT
eukprot:snap_masked-scaffold_44-processed-gene-1.23-mRNA-1 protein AED:1.00 eAED:1.00 QI:0/-1/0/0/-1/1/1/0/80